MNRTLFDEAANKVVKDWREYNKNKPTPTLKDAEEFIKKYYPKNSIEDAKIVLQISLPKK